MNSEINIGNVSWTRDELINSLQEFSELYKERPIIDNKGGMESPHMYATWFILRKINPSAVIESGVWYGQGTWLLQQACPEASIHSIDLNLNHRKYISEKVKYYNQDFSKIDWTGLPSDETILFFDDHQNAYKRIMIAKWFGFKHLIFEDNYPASQGDCYSLKKIFMHAGLTTKQKEKTNSILRKVGFLKKKIALNEENNIKLDPNYIDEKNLRKNIKIYYEFPPIFKSEMTRWGDKWDDINYPTPEPILTKISEEYHRIFLKEAKSYTWLCYVELN